MNFSELLKASKGLPVDDMIAALWGKKIYDANEWQITTLTGSLPLTYESRTEHILKNYVLYGSASGSGTNEYNLCDLPTFSATWATTSTTLRDSVNALTPGTYTFSCKFKVTSRNDTSDASVCGITLVSSVAGQNISIRKFVGDADVGDIVPFKGTFTISSQNADTYTAAYVYGCGIEGIGATGSAQCMETVLNAGTDALPYGYKIPLVNAGKNLWQHSGVPIYDYSSDYKRYNANKAVSLSAGTYTLSSDGRLPTIQAFTSELVQVAPITDIISYPRGTYNPAWDDYAISAPGVSVSKVVPITLSQDAILTFAIITNAGTYLRINKGNTVSSADYPLYIGDSKLGEEEYLDYETGKIYKMIDGVLTPTDPPVSLPAILTYQGENTLSSTETLGEAEITGRIKSII